MVTPVSYQRALEERCRSSEALIGILLSIPDQRAITLLSELSKNAHASSVLRQVNSGPFGLRRKESSTKVTAESNLQSGSVFPLNVLLNSLTFAPEFECIVNGGPSRFTQGAKTVWQDSVIDKFKRNERNHGLQPFGATLQSPAADSSSDASQSSEDPSSPIESK